MSQENVEIVRRSFEVFNWMASRRCSTMAS